MKDLFGVEIQIDDVIAYANDSGWLCLAIVSEVDQAGNTLKVIKRGYKGSSFTKVLPRPADVLVVTEKTLDQVAENCSRPEEVQFILNALKQKANVVC